MRIIPWLLICLSLAAVTFAQSAPAAKPVGFSIDNIDKTVDPCVDFYQYACGNWLKTTEIPADESEWVSFSELYERNLVTEREILEKAAVVDPKRSAIEQKIGDFYSSCVDEKAVDAKGIDPLKPDLDRIAAAKDKAALIEVLAHQRLIGANALFRFFSDPDLHNAGMVIANLDQGGLSLPDRDYYLKDDPKMAEMRQHLVEYAVQIFTLAGETPQQAAESAKTVMRIETALAKAEMDRTLRRDPKSRDHKMSKDQALALAPNFYLTRYLAAVGAPSFTEVNVGNPEFFKQVNSVIDSESLDALKTYSALASARFRRALALQALCGCELQNDAIPDRPDRESTALEALRGCHRRFPRRSSGREVRRTDIRRRRQTAHAEDGRCAGKVAG